jgi:hypothetical protein
MREGTALQDPSDDLDRSALPDRPRRPHRGRLHRDQLVARRTASFWRASAGSSTRRSAREASASRNVRRGNPRGARLPRRALTRTCAREACSRTVWIGNFVEIKNASLGAGTRAAHLSFIGDAHVGRNVTHRLRIHHLQLERPAAEAAHDHRGRRLHRQRMPGDRAGDLGRGKLRRDRNQRHRRRAAGLVRDQPRTPGHEAGLRQEIWKSQSAAGRHRAERGLPRPPHHKKKNPGTPSVKNPPDTTKAAPLAPETALPGVTQPQPGPATQPTSPLPGVVQPH